MRKLGNAGLREAQKRVGRLRDKERGDRLLRIRAVDDRLDGKLRMEARGRTDHGQHHVELGRRREDVERALVDVVARARDGEVDDARGRHVDLACGEARERLGRGLRDLDPAHRQRIDHHGGAAGCGREHRNLRRPRTDGADRRAAYQRQRLEQRFEAFDARDAAISEECARDIVLAGERAGMRDGDVARRGGTAELVADDRLAARRRAEREFAQHGCVADRFEKQQIAVDVRIIECRQANLADREIDLVADRHEAREADSLLFAARHQRADHGTGMRGEECAADRDVSFRERGVCGEHHAFAQIDDAEARRADHADAGLGRDFPQMIFARKTVRAGLREAGRQNGGDLHAGAPAFGDGVDHGVGADHDVGVVRRLGQRADGFPRALAEHRLAPRIDRIDRAAIARLAEELQRPAGRLSGVVRLADDRHRARREQRLAQGRAIIRWGQHGVSVFFLSS